MAEALETQTSDLDDYPPLGTARHLLHERKLAFSKFMKTCNQVKGFVRYDDNHAVVVALKIPLRERVDALIQAHRRYIAAKDYIHSPEDANFEANTRQKEQEVMASIASYVGNQSRQGTPKNPDLYQPEEATNYEEPDAQQPRRMTASPTKRAPSAYGPAASFNPEPYSPVNVGKDPTQDLADRLEALLKVRESHFEFLRRELERERKERQAIEHERRVLQSNLHAPPEPVAAGWTRTTDVSAGAIPRTSNTRSNPGVPTRGTMGNGNVGQRPISNSPGGRNSPGGTPRTSIFRMPKINIEPFNGDPRKWPNFIAMFRSLVEEDETLDDTRRMAVLMLCLTEEIRKSLGDLVNEPENYQEVLEELEASYGHPHLVSQTYVQTLLELPKVSHLNDYKGLSSFSNSLRGAVASLKKRGYEHELRASSLLDQMTRKLPEALRSRWGRKIRKTPNAVLGLEEFSAWLKEYVQAEMMVRHFDFMESATVLPSSPSPAPRRQTLSRPTPAPRHSIQRPNVLTTTKESPPKSCPKCEGPHKLSSCVEYSPLSPEARADLIIKLGCCFRCLTKGHRSRDCSSNKKCSIEGCNGLHHTTLHNAPRIFPKRTPNPTAPSPSRPSIPDATVGTATMKEPETSIFMSVVPVTLRNGDISTDTFALLDNGSEVSLILAGTAKTLGLHGPAKVIRLGTFHGNDPRIKVSTVTFTVTARDGSSPFKIQEALTVPHLSLSTKKCDWSEAKRSCPHLSDLTIPATDYSKVSVIIGRNCVRAHDIFEYRAAPDPESGPEAVLTPFGWCIVGPVHRSFLPKMYEATSVFHVHLSSDELLHQSVSKMWTTEAFGALKEPKPIQTPAEKRAVEVLESTTRHDGERYEIGLLWKNPEVKLPNNRETVLRQFIGLERRFEKDPEYAKRYDDQMQIYIKSGFAVAVEPGPEDITGRVWYLPHHGVISPSKPDKLRIVHNCSSRFQNTSLNDVLLKGPDLLVNMTSVLLNFRKNPVAVSADIEKMFFQVRVRPQDQQALRFLYRSPGSTQPIKTYQMTVHVFGAVSSPTTCLFALRRTGEDFKTRFPDVAQLISTNMYMDNFLYSTETEEDAIDHSKQLKELCQCGGFKLTQWMSTSRRLLKEIGRVNLSTPVLNLDLDPLPTERALGLLFDWQTDRILFTLTPKTIRTMRELLREVSSIHDPLGLIAVVVLRVRILFQDTWRAGVGWDDPLPSKFIKIWDRWTKEVRALTTLRIPRCIRRNLKPISCEFHAFSDASESGFGAAIYYRTCYTDGLVQICLVIGKARVAPLRQLSIPRLELQGAVMASRLAKTTRHELSMNEIPMTFWTDSNTVLQWIYSTSCRFHAFVAHRITEILEITEGCKWRHVPGDVNPADDASRGIPATDLSPKHRWYNGPPFLLLPPEFWPLEQPISKPDDNDPEIAATHWIGAVLCPKDHPIIKLEEKIYRLLQPAIRLQRIIAWLLRFTSNYFERKENPNRSIWLSVGELNDADKYLIRLDQWYYFAEDLKMLKNGKPIAPPSILCHISPFIDIDGVLRAGGRLQKGPISFDLKHPTILHHKSILARIIIRNRHLELAHSSVERTLHDLRGEYYVLRFRSVVRSVKNNCRGCRILHAKPEIPLMAALPSDRVKPLNRPFTSTGIDYFGPIEIMFLRRQIKRYGVIFTCLTTRAVHLEIAHSLDVNSFLMAFERFTDRRGNPRAIYSDNGTNLTAGERELRENIEKLNNSTVQASLSRRKIEWHFSPPSAPHFGGVWERLIRSAKTSLNAILRNRTVTDEILLTAMCGVEKLLNSRPLTHVAVDPAEPSALTPNHFLLGHPNSEDPLRVDDIPPSISTKSWKYSQLLIDQFWQRWLREYAPNLIENRKWLKPRRNLQVGDIVIIVDPNNERGKWPQGRITRVFPGSDNIVRAAEVSTSDTVLTRPVSKLCLLEPLNPDISEHCYSLNM